jgi:DNA (cytosine-5)-methyltransferase 1
VNHLSLFSGIGGIDLAAHWAGMRTVAFVEQNKFCQQVLTKHWPGVPIFDDVCTLTAEDLHESIDIISGGFPCQPFSKAGKRLGGEDDRYLWPQFARLIEELRPTWVVGENVAGIITLALDDVLANLESLGYATSTFVIPACAVGARHRRERVFIVAHSDCKRLLHGQLKEHTAEARIHALSDLTASSENVAHAQCFGQSGQGLHARPINSEANKNWEANWAEYGGQGNQAIWDIEPSMGRVADGVPSRVDRLKALGNAVVPQQVYPIFKAIAEIEATA